MRGTVLAVTHGGGPMPLLGSPDQKTITDSLKNVAPKALKLTDPATAPRAILIVTAHWETPVATVSIGDKPSLYYDYYGFPDEAYNIEFPYVGSRNIANEVVQTLKEAGVEVAVDQDRGWDHGVFVPLKLIAPPTSTPLIQLSVLASQDPSALFGLGRALAPLRDSNIAIIGSGSAGFHNLRLLFMGAASSPGIQAKAKVWTKTLDEVMEMESAEERGKRLEGWKDWEGALEMHPRGATEHFSPLVVIAGAAGEGKAKSWKDEMAGFKMGSYYWD